MFIDISRMLDITQHREAILSDNTVLLTPNNIQINNIFFQNWLKIKLADNFTKKLHFSEYSRKSSVVSIIPDYYFSNYTFMVYAPSRSQ